MKPFRFFPLGVAAGAALEFLVTAPDAPPHLRGVAAGLACLIGVFAYVAWSEFWDGKR